MNVALHLGHRQGRTGAYNKSRDISEYSFNTLLMNLVYGKLLSFNKKDLNMNLYTDFTLEKSIDALNNTQNDLIVSFHSNAYNESVSGTEVLYLEGTILSRNYAEIMQGFLIDSLHINDRGIKGLIPLDRGYKFVKETRDPCIIIEPFFIDNDFDLTIAIANFNLLVHQIALGILKILE